MDKLFKHYDALRVFSIVAHHGSFSAAAEPLHLTKGAVSHQIRQLELAIGFTVFNRKPRGISLTREGKKLLAACESSFANIDQTLKELQNDTTIQITLGITTYFASRWLSPRLMTYMQLHPDVQLRLQPVIDMSDLDAHGIDLGVRWGNGNWKDQSSQLLFTCPAWPCGNKQALELVNKQGANNAFRQLTLLHDRRESQVWSEWYRSAGMEYPDREASLIIPDPNVRVEGVKEGQGIAMNDNLVEPELLSGRLFRLSDIELSDYGYFLVFNERARDNPAVEGLANWMLEAATKGRVSVH